EVRVRSRLARRRLPAEVCACGRVRIDRSGRAARRRRGRLELHQLGWTRLSLRGRRSGSEKDGDENGGKRHVPSGTSSAGSIGSINRPEASFGKKYVDFCGMISPASTTALSCATAVGLRRNTACTSG